MPRFRQILNRFDIGRHILDAAASGIRRYRFAETAQAYDYGSMSIGILCCIQDGILNGREFLEPYEFAIELPTYLDVGNNQTDFNLAIGGARLIRSDDQLDPLPGRVLNKRAAPSGTREADEIPELQVRLP